jgi:predicted thioesterase
LAVFATPVLVALMEQAACACLDGLLPEAETSVGVKVAAEHTAPTPVGATVTAVATITAWEGRTVAFAIEASDQAGPVGQAEHTRAVVDGARLLAKAQTRA